MDIPGGIVDVPDCNSLEIVSLARFAVEDYNKKQNALLEFAGVVHAKQQVVEGMKYYITLNAKDGGVKKLYETTIWVKTYENFKEVQAFKLVNDGASSMPGGIVDVPDCNSLEIVSLARFAVEDYNKKQNALLEFAGVVHAKQQVVEGMKYYITLNAKDGGVKKLYETTIWVKTYENFKEVQEFKLVNDGASSMPGGIVDVPDCNSLEIVSLARFAVEDYNKKQNALLEFAGVVHAKQQVVEGMKYYITLNAKDGGVKKLYETTIWVKTYENFKEVQAFKLVNDGASSMPGGIVDVPDCNSLEIVSLARFAVEDYNKKQNALLEFAGVVHAKQQVVAGMMYYITLNAIDGGVKKLYETKIWVQTYENFKEVQEFKLVNESKA